MADSKRAFSESDRDFEEEDRAAKRRRSRWEDGPAGDNAATEVDLSIYIDPRFTYVLLQRFPVSCGCSLTDPLYAHTIMLSVAGPKRE